MRRAKSKRARRSLAWFAVAFLLGQLVLAVLIDQAWPAVRDPEWTDLVQRLRLLRAARPHAPLVVVLGSSRSELVFDAARLSRSPSGPLVFNACVPGAGPLAQRVLLERLLASDLRPDHVIVEVMPPFFSETGACFEDGFPAWQRLTLVELLSIIPRAREPSRPIKRWLKARLLPIVSGQDTLQAHLLPAKWCPGGSSGVLGRDGYGWKAAPACSAAHRAERTAFMLEQYNRALRSPVLCEERVGSLGDLLGRCRQQGIGCTLLVPPENSAFRTRTAASVRRGLNAALAELSRKYQVRLHDARTWLSDEEFIDGHHATREGAIRFTTRFEKQALRAALSRR